MDLDTLEAITVLFEAQDASESFQATFADEGVLEVPEDMWLQTNGLVTEVPCPEQADN